MSPESIDIINLVKEIESLGGIILAENLLRDRIVEIYKSDEGINSKIAELKPAFPDGEIIDDIEKLYDEGKLELRDGEGSKKEDFLERPEGDQEVTFFYPEKLKYKE